MEYLETGRLSSDQKKARELVLLRQHFVEVEGVLYYIRSRARIIPHTVERENLFWDVHGGTFGGHLREAKIQLVARDEE